jgi:hypothetical protein
MPGRHLHAGAVSRRQMRNLVHDALVEDDQRQRVQVHIVLELLRRGCGVVFVVLAAPGERYCQASP